MSVTRIRPALHHFEPCDRQALGAVVQSLPDGYRASREAIERSAERMQSTWNEPDGYRCDCLSLRLAAADNAVRLARAAWRASTTDENAQRVADAIARRDAIRDAR